MHLVEKLQNFEHTPSNLLRRLFCGFFAKGGVVGTHPNDVDV
jgi:hypothetical protein